MRRNRGIIGPLLEVKRIDTASGIYDTFDNYNYRLINEWPLVKEHLNTSITPSTTVVEGNTLNCMVTVAGYEDEDLLYYTINTVSGTTMVGADFSDGLVQDSFEINNNLGFINKTLVPEGVTENNQFTFQIRTGSVSGPIVLTSATITVTDASDPTGQANYLSAGTYSWTAPGGVTSVCALAIGGGGGGIAYACCYYGMMGGGGGGLGWKNNISVTPGNNYTVVVGAAGQAGQYSSGSTSGGISYFISSGYARGIGGSPGRYNNHVYGGGYNGDGGGSGGMSYRQHYSYGPGSGGGAGGYSGNGGNGRQTTYTSGYSTPSGGGGGGGCGVGTTSATRAWGGGGVGIYGQGSSGGTATSSHPGGYGGSGGTDGIQGSNQAVWGGLYGGGGGGATAGYSTSGDGGGGAVRLIWGTGRAYPSTLTTDQ